MRLVILIVTMIVFQERFYKLCFFLKGAEAQSQLRRPGESELDYYERRYQERVSGIYCHSVPVCLCVC